MSFKNKKIEEELKISILTSGVKNLCKLKKRKSKMNIVVATIAHSQTNENNIDVQLEEVEFDGKLETLVEILGIAQYRPAEVYNDGSGGGCSATTISIGKNYSTMSICDEHIYPTAFELDGISFYGDRKIALVGIENFINNTPIMTLEHIKSVIEPSD